MLNSRQQFGDYGEKVAEKVLIKKGYKILERKFRSRMGEIDLIAQDNKTLVFVEVKSRLNTKYGRPEEAVTPWKIRHIQKTAEYYCLIHKIKSAKMRIEVVAIQYKEGKLESIRIIPIV
jgi:putative endonuclease